VRSALGLFNRGGPFTVDILIDIENELTYSDQHYLQLSPEISIRLGSRMNPISYIDDWFDKDFIIPIASVPLRDQFHKISKETLNTRMNIADENCFFRFKQRLPDKFSAVDVIYQSSTCAVDLGRLLESRLRESFNESWKRER
jgi:hypothetical protein